MSPHTVGIRKRVPITHFVPIDSSVTWLNLVDCSLMLVCSSTRQSIMLAPEEVVGPLRRPNLHHHPLKIADRPEPLRRAESRGPPLEHRREGAGLGVRVAQRATIGHTKRRSA